MHIDLKLGKIKVLILFFFLFLSLRCVRLWLGLGDVCYRKAYEFNSVYNLKALDSFGYVVFMQ